MRTAALAGAAEFTRARLDAGAAGFSRQTVDAVLQRPDEPGELLAYWTSRYGRNLPQPVKRGVTDAARRLFGGLGDAAFRLIPLLEAGRDAGWPWQ